MKRIFTLLIALGAITVAQAQYGHSYPNDRSQDRDVILGQRNDRAYDNSRYDYSFNERDRDKQIDRINKEYDKQIRRIDKDRRMSPYDKSYQIRNLEDRRRNEIRQVWDRYRNSNNTYTRNNRYQQNDRRW